MALDDIEIRDRWRPYLLDASEREFRFQLTPEFGASALSHPVFFSSVSESFS